ncbi:MAG: hypothetical protein ACRDRJ_09380 [Streptosporangiaceae bacterium]
MAVDVTSEIVISRPADVVAADAADPSNARPGTRTPRPSPGRPPRRCGPDPGSPSARASTYAWQAIDDRSTRMTLRNRGEPAGFPKLAAPLMAIAMRRANRKDLHQLRIILQAH